MTQEQREALDTIKATYAYATDNENVLATYSNERIAVLIQLIEAMDEKLENAKKDLLDLSEYVGYYNDREFFVQKIKEVVDFTLISLTSEE